MTPKELAQRDFSKELQYSATRSSGPGGQNVNKVNTKIELRFNIRTSTLLSEQEKHLLQHKLSKRLNNEGELLLTSQSERSQLKNKDAVTARFFDLLAKALTPPKKRKPTKRTKASILKRLDEKRKQSDKKANRKYRAM